MITNPQRTGRAGRTALSAALPAVALGAGLVVVLIGVRQSRSLTPEHIAAFHRLLYEPAPIGSTGPTTFPRISPFDHGVEHRSWMLTLLFALVYLGSATAVGSRVVTALRGNDMWPVAVRLLAGFLPGYLLMLAPLQLLYGAVPLVTASWIALVVAPAAALLVHRRGLLATVRRGSLEHRRIGDRLRSGALAVGGVAGMVALAGIHRLQQAIYYLTQDSIAYLLQGAQLQLAGRNGEYLGHWTTQTDEWLFNAPLMYAHGGEGDLWFPFYITQSVALASFLCLTYGVIHRLARRRQALTGMAAVAAMFGFTQAIFPWVYAPVVIGGQPLIGLAHPGRLLGIAAPWAVVVLLGGGGLRRVGIPALALATLGFGFLTLNAVLYVGVAVMGTVLWRGMRERERLFETRWARGVAHLAAPSAMTLAIGASAFTRGVPSTAWLPVGMLLAAAAVAVLGAVVVAWGTTGRRGVLGRRSPMWLVAWTMAAIGGLLFSDALLGGGLAPHVHSAIARVLPGFGGSPLRRADLPDGLLAGVEFPSFSTEVCNTNVSCGGVPFFLVSYGVLFALTLSAWVAFGPLRPKAVAINQRRVAALVALAGMAVALVLVFYTGLPNLEGSILTRFLELPYYTLLIVGVLGFCESRRRGVVVVGLCMLAIWTIAPLIAVDWPEQMWRNLKFYVEELGMS